MTNVAEDDRELCFEVLFAGVASLGDSSEVLAHAGEVELWRELQQVLGVDSILQSSKHDITFVGSANDYSVPTVDSVTFPKNHEGHGGYTIEGNSGIGAWAVCKQTFAAGIRSSRATTSMARQ